MKSLATLDARTESRQQRELWERVRRAERQYAVQLRKIARHIADIVSTFGADDPERVNQMQATLQRYADLIRPWARAAARRMLLEVARRDETAWRRFARLMGETIRLEIASAPVAPVFQQLLEQQVALITSLPVDAAQRVHELATKTIYQGGRANELAAQIMDTGNVSKARATLIARTEIARAATTFTMVRAKHIGAESYVWRTARDRRVRPLHRKLEGKTFYWDNPPITGENGERSHPGCVYNCRCYPEVVIPREFT